jgi:ATP-dependent helicase/nuclease subunit B
MGRCPLSYFFKYVLRIVPPDPVEADPGKWLDPGPFGELLHEIFYRFMSRLIAEHRRPSYDRDRAALFKILGEHVKRYARIYPPARTSAFERQLRLMERAARIFLIEEEELCHTSQPKFLEAAIGLDSDLEESLLQSREPVSVNLSADKTVRLRARIDRIDFTGTEEEPVYVIWDYKTGSAWKYEKHDALWQGRIVQHAVYLEVARHMLRKRVSPTAEVSHFGYFFPGQGARGLRLVHWKHQLEHARDVIEKLCLIASTGAFLATDNAKDDCTYCDYNTICRDVEATAAAARRKLENPANEILEPVRQLRGVANDDAA